MTTLAGLTTTIFGSDGSQGIVQDSSFYASATSRINAAVTAISGGLRMPDGQTSPPLPDLIDMQTVETSITLPYVSLPSDAGHVYQRGLFMVADSSGYQIFAPRGGDYYSFKLFLKQASNKGLSQAGAISTVCVQGTHLYYQGIPSTAEALTLHYYRAPVDMALDTAAPDGLPAHLSERLIVHYVCKEIFGDIEDGDNSQGAGFKYHTLRFFEVMTDLLDFVGIDAEPEYYGTGGRMDAGVCD